MSSTLTAVATVLGSGGLTVVINRAFNWLDKRHEARMKAADAAEAAAVREAEAEEAKAKLHADTEAWLRAKVDAMVENERATYRAMIAAHTKTIEDMRESVTLMQGALQSALSDVAERDARIAALEATLAEFPDLIEKFVIVIAGIDKDKTPTPEQLSAMHDLAKRMRLHERVPNHVLLAKVGS